MWQFAQISEFRRASRPPNCHAKLEYLKIHQEGETLQIQISSCPVQLPSCPKIASALSKDTRSPRAPAVNHPGHPIWPYVFMTPGSSDAAGVPGDVASTRSMQEASCRRSRAFVGASAPGTGKLHRKHLIVANLRGGLSYQYCLQYQLSKATQKF
jgi:hypothetical protein